MQNRVDLEWYPHRLLVGGRYQVQRTIRDAQQVGADNGNPVCVHGRWQWAGHVRLAGLDVDVVGYAYTADGFPTVWSDDCQQSWHDEQVQTKRLNPIIDAAMQRAGWRRSWSSPGEWVRFAAGKPTEHAS